MIDKQYECGEKIFVLSCDICGEQAEETMYNFKDAVEYKRVHGWKSQKDKHGWMDVCSKCAKEGKG